MQETLLIRKISGGWPDPDGTILGSSRMSGQSSVSTTRSGHLQLYSGDVRYAAPLWTPTCRITFVYLNYNSIDTYNSLKSLVFYVSWCFPGS
jgi:hypothetical protein